MVNRRIRRRNVIDPMSVCNWLKFRIFMNCLCYLIWSILLSHVFNTLKISNMNVSVGGFLHCFWFATVIFPLPGWNRKKTLNLLICKVSPVVFILCKVGDCPHLVPCNQCLGSGTKWCCVHNLSTLYATVFLITQLSPFRRHFETWA